MKLVTDRIVIDDIKELDKYDYFINISNDKEVLKTFICNYCDDINNFDFSRYLNRDDIYAIRLKETGKLIGILVICEKDSENKSLEIGYGIGSRHWNKGYTTEAVKVFIDYLFKNEDINTIYASHFVDNIASNKVMIKCGMTYSHTNLKELYYLGEERDLIYYRIDKQV